MKKHLSLAVAILLSVSSFAQKQDVPFSVIENDNTQGITYAGQTGGAMKLRYCNPNSGISGLRGNQSETLTVGGCFLPEKASKLYRISEEELPDNEIVLVGLKTLKYADVLVDSFELEGTIRNSGQKAITSFDVTCTVNDGESITEKIEAVNVEAKQSSTFRINVPNNNIVPSKNNIKVKIANPNQVGDSEDDNELTTSLIGYDASNNKETRKVLLEQFTTVLCSNCPAGYDKLNRVLSTKENVIWVSHHSGYYTDEYTIDESKKYLWLYNSGSTFAPAAMLNRTNLYLLGAVSNNSPVFSISSGEDVISKLIDYELNTPPFVKIEIQRDYNPENRNLKLTVNSEKIEGMPLESNTVMNVFLYEDGIVGTQSGANGDFTHNHVIRKVITSTWGDKVTYNSTGIFFKSYSLTIPSKWKTENMKVVAFISNYTGLDPNNCNVYNSEIVDLEGTMSSTESPNSPDNVSVFGKDGNMYVNINTTGHVAISLFDLSGKILLTHQTYLNGDNLITVPVDLHSGVYLMKITAKEGTVVKKILYN